MAALSLPPVRLAGIALCALLDEARLAHAGGPTETYVWSGASGPPFLWSTASNWAGLVAPPPVGNSILSFGTTAGSTAPTASIAHTIERIEFHDALPYTISGAMLTILGFSGINASCSADCAVSNATTILTNQNWTNTGLGRLTMGAVNLNGHSLAIHAGGSSPIDITGAITGTGSLFKHSLGVLTLSGANTYVGSTTVLAGTLRAGASNVIPSGKVTVRRGTLDLNGFSEVIGPGSVADTGLVMGTYPTDGSAAGATSTVHSPDQPLAISTLGTFIALDPAGSPGTAEITGVLNLGTTSGTRTIDVGDSPVTDVDLKISADIVNLAGISGSASIIDKIGAGRLELSGAGSFPRGVTVSEGVLRVSNALALGATGDFNFTGTVSGAGIELSPGVVIAGERLILNGSGAGDSETLRALAGGTSEWTGPISLGPFEVTFGADIGAILICDQVVTSSSSTLTVRGGGTLVLPNNNSGYVGKTSIESGTTLRVMNASGLATGIEPVLVRSAARLEGTGQIGAVECLSGGIVEPGVSVPGMLRILGRAILRSGSKLRIKATSTLPAGCAGLAVTGNANLAGTLELSATFTPAVGDSFVVLTCGSRTGTFKSFSLPALPNDRTWVLEHKSTSVVLRVVATIDVTPPASMLTALEQVAPNPFMDRATIGYALAKPGRVDVDVFDAGGRRVTTLVGGVETPAGRHQVSWSGRDAAGRACRPALYWIRMSVDGVALAPKRVSLSR